MTKAKDGRKLYSLEAVSEAFDIDLPLLKRMANAHRISIKNGVTMNEIEIIVKRAKAEMRRNDVDPKDVLEIVNAFKDVEF